MAARIGTGLSTATDAREAAMEAAAAAREGLGGARADLCVVFGAGRHLAAPEAMLESVDDVLSPGVLVGCGAGGVLAGRREIERGTALTVWAAALGEGTATPFRMEVREDEDELPDENDWSPLAAISGVPELEGASAALLFADPFAFPVTGVLAGFSERSRSVPILGGVSSAGTSEGAGALFLGGEVLDSGAVGVRLDGVEVLPCVSQGAGPIGPEMTITAAEDNVILELAGRPAIERLREAISELSADDHGLLASGLLIGLVIEGAGPDYGQGDFLVRPLVAADPKSGALAVGAAVRPGQVIRLHARNAASADRDLREALELRARALGGTAAGALMFSCNGRGRGMFGVPDHDVAAFAEALGAPPVAGFFAAGEIGPVGGESFVHGFTATLAIFAP